MPQSSTVTQIAGSTPRRSARETQKLQTRERLTQALFEVVARQGYSNASVDAVSRAAGVSRGTFYLHFPSKVELAEAVIADVREKWSDVVTVSVTSRSSVVEIEAMLEQWIDFYAQELDAFRVWHEVAVTDPGVATRVLRESTTSAREVLPGLPQQADRDRTALQLSMMLSQIDQLCYAWFLSEAKPYPREFLVREVAMSWKHYFLPRLEGKLSPD